MSNLLLFALLGLGAGGITALLGVGLVGAYQASGVVNFAQGAMAMYCAYCYSELRETGELVLPVIGLPHRVPLAGDALATGPALAITLIYAALLGVGLYLLIFRPLRHAPALAKVVASIGLMLALQALAIIHFGSSSAKTTAVLPTDPVDILGVSIAADRLWLAAIAVAASLVVAGIYRYTRFGVITRAVAQNERAAALHGWRPVRIEAANWALASLLAGLAGVLAAPIVSLSPSTMTLAVVPALAAALVAQFSSFPIAAAAGLAIGVGQSLCIKAAADWSWFPQQGMAETLPFLVIAIVMVARGRRLPTRGEPIGGHLPRAPQAKRPLPLTAVAVAAGTILVVATQQGWRAAVIQSLVTACVCLSFVVLTGFVGQASLAQAAFAGVGGFTLAKILDNVGLPFPAGLLIAGLAAVPIGLIVGIPALRIRGVNLAIITLGAGVALDALVFRNEWVSGGLTGTSVPAPTLFGVDVGIQGDQPSDYPRIVFGLVALATLAVLAILVVNLRRSPTGYHFLAVRSNERAASAIGINVSTAKFLAFAISAFIAGAAGGLLGYQQGQLSPESFSIFVALALLSIAYIGGIATVAGAVAAGFILAPGGLVFTALERWFEFGRYQPLIAGVGVIISAILNPDGIAVPKRPRRKPAPQPAATPARPLTPVRPALHGEPV